MRRYTLMAVSLVSLGLSTSCGSDAEPVDVNGNYTLQLLNGRNDCALTNFNEGDSATVAITVTQDPANPKTATVRFTNPLLVALFMVGGIPTTLIATVNGADIDATGLGRTEMMSGCESTLKLRVEASLDRNTLEGTTTWSYQTNGHTDCGLKVTCATRQSFNGTRPLGG